MTGKYRSTMHALGTIVKEERFIGLYKGITSPLVCRPCHTNMTLDALIPVSGHRCPNEWPSVRLIQVFHEDPIREQSSIPTLTQIALAGAGSGIVSSYVSYLTERCPILIAWRTAS